MRKTNKLVGTVTGQVPEFYRNIGFDRRSFRVFLEWLNPSLRSNRHSSKERRKLGSEYFAEHSKLLSGR
jgi:hypothetical protein